MGSVNEAVAQIQFRMNAKTILVPVVVLLAAGFAFTQAARNGGALEARFNQFDTNKDGVLTDVELDGAPILRQLDLNHDNKLTKEEALEGLAKLKRLAAPSTPPVGGEKRTGVLFRSLDKNSDGRLVPGELTNAEIFAKLDGNKDGAVTLEESLKILGEIIPDKWLNRRGDTAPAESVSLQEMPRRLKGSEHGVGGQVADVPVKDTQGRDATLSSLGGNKAVVVAMFSASCPISAKLGPELARIEKDYAGKQVAFLLVTPVAEDTTDDIATFTSAYSLRSPVVHDAKGEFAIALGATTTTEVFLIDSSRTLVYRGAINDQYGLGYSKDAPTESYLRAALDATLRSEKPAITATTAPGCALDLKAATSTAARTTATYHREISRILQSHCVECHHADGIGPFSLETYADVIEHAGMIKKQVTRGAMPPWFAAKQPGETESPWSNDCSLSERDKAELLAWLDSPRPQGDVKDAPIARSWSSEWTIGKPDYIVQLPRPVAIKAEGTMPYQVVTAETTLMEDKWVQAYEIMPTNRKVVHHVIVTVHPKGTGRVKDREEGAGGYWAAYVPGNSKQFYPDGFARKLPAGSVVSFQIHYTPNGKATEDQLRMGLIFAKQNPRYVVETTALPRRALNIPPGEANHVETEVRTIPFDMNVMAFMAHMHVRGKSFKYELIKKDGTLETLLDIPRYDFNWQLRYDLGQYRLLPRGTQLKITAVFDNSPANAANPDPTKLVKWGPQTFDEMMIGYVEHFVPVSGGKVAAIR